MKTTSKSKNRLELLDMVTESLTSDRIFETINYQTQSEDKIKQFMYPHLLEAFKKFLIENRHFDREVADMKAKQCLLWEGNKKTTVKNMMFMGTQNRPDMVVELGDVRIAIEIKRGETGSDLRSGFGQSMIYSTVYDFVLYLFIDTSKDKKILNASSGGNEIDFVETLWKNFNIRFAIV